MVNNKNKRLTVTLPKPLVARVQRMAKKKHLSKSVVVQMALVAGLDQLEGGASNGQAN